MRTDRTVSIVLSKFKKNASDNKIPILMYHSITPEIKIKPLPAFLWVPPIYCIQANLYRKQGFTGG